MLRWLRGKPKRPSYTDMVAKVASLIDGFRELQGLEEFSKSRLSVIITTDYKAVISDGRFTPNPLQSKNAYVVSCAGEGPCF